jgi:hypothetical protein
LSVVGGGTGPGQMLAISVFSGLTDGSWPSARSIFSLELAGRFGLNPVVNGGFHQVL